MNQTEKLLPARNDVFLCSYPKSGNTYLRHLLFCYLNNSHPDYDRVEYEIPYFAWPWRRSPLGIWKTHAPLTPRFKKAVYLVRDPRDVIASLYRAQRRRNLVPHGEAEYVQRFLDGSVSSYGSWASHVASLANYMDDHPNWTVIHYEQLRQNPLHALKTTLNACEIAFDERLARKAVQMCSVENVRIAEERSSILARQFGGRPIPIVGDGDTRTNPFRAPPLENEIIYQTKSMFDFQSSIMS